MNTVRPELVVLAFLPGVAIFLFCGWRLRLAPEPWPRVLIGTVVGGVSVFAAGALEHWGRGVWGVVLLGGGRALWGGDNLLTGYPPTATVRTATPVDLAVLGWKDLEPVLAKTPRVGVHLLTVLESRHVEDQTPRIERSWALMRRWLSDLFARVDQGDSAWQARFPAFAVLPRASLTTVRDYSEEVSRAGADDAYYIPDREGAGLPAIGEGEFAGPLGSMPRSAEGSGARGAR